MTRPLSTDLGRLARPPQAAAYDDARLVLLDRLLQAEARGELTAAEWEVAFAAAAELVRDHVMTRAAEAMTAAAARARVPATALQAQLPTAVAGEALLHRLLACAIPLEALADGGDGPAVRRARGAALEGAWEAAMAIAAADAARWERAAAELATWRRPVRPRVIGLVVLALMLVVVGGWLGGQLPAPGWFEPLHAAFWSLPWP